MRPQGWMAGYRSVFLASALVLLGCGGGGDKAGDSASKAPDVPPAVIPSCTPPAAGPKTANVKDALYGAIGNGVADDTLAIQKAVDAVAGTGGTVVVPPGTYLINTITNSNRGILLRSNMTLALDPAATLQAIPNASANYVIILVSGASNVNVTGGTLLGDRSAHLGTTGQWGHGISIQDGSTNVVVSGVTSKECWGDGFYLAHCTSVAICGCTSDHNRRQGLTITSGNAIAIRNSHFTNTVGTTPECGIDIEPNSGDTVNNVLVSNCTFSGNAGDGLADGVPISLSGAAFIMGVKVDGCTFTSNGTSANPSNGLEVSNCSGHTFTNNTVQNNYGTGIYLREGANNHTVTGNTVTGNTEHGIFQYKSTGNTVSSNTVSGNTLTP